MPCGKRAYAFDSPSNITYPFFKCLLKLSRVGHPGQFRRETDQHTMQTRKGACSLYKNNNFELI